ncbi:MAG: hypothetical protein ABSE90_00995 [Verrucomicrobiota bacterium]
MSVKIPFDAMRLKSRLSQPRMTRVEALKQLQATMPLTPSALKELQSSNGGSGNGPKKTAN